MFVRALSLSASLALLIICCACSSAAFQPAQQIIHVDRSASTINVNSTLRVSILVLVEAPQDPRVPDLYGNLVYPDDETARLHGRWLRAGIREDARMQDFIQFSGAYEYSWWQGGGGLTLKIQGKPDMTRLALRWGKFFPDVVRDMELSTPAASRTSTAPPTVVDPRYQPAGYYPYGGQPCNSSYNDPYNAYCSGCGLARLNCSCPGNCCGNQVSPKFPVVGGVDQASGPFARR